MRYILFSLLLLSNTTLVLSSESAKVFYSNKQFDPVRFELGYADSVDDQIPELKPKGQKLKAVVLALFLGHFGAHRIYLGTEANVPVVYSLTLGGGFGLLPLLDIIAILSSKDLSEFSGSNQVIMWIE